MKKVHAVQPGDTLYPFGAGNKIDIGAPKGGGYIGTEIIIGGDKYKLMVDEAGNRYLVRYNKKYKVWVQLKFIGNNYDNLESIIVDTLQEQFIHRILGENRG